MRRGLGVRRRGGARRDFSLPEVAVRGGGGEQNEAEGRDQQVVQEREPRRRRHEEFKRVQPRRCDERRDARVSPKRAPRRVPASAYIRRFGFTLESDRKLFVPSLASAPGAPRPRARRTRAPSRRTRRAACPSGQRPHRERRRDREPRGEVRVGGRQRERREKREQRRLLVRLETEQEKTRRAVEQAPQEPPFVGCAICAPWKARWRRPSPRAPPEPPRASPSSATGKAGWWRTKSWRRSPRKPARAARAAPRRAGRPPSRPSCAFSGPPRERTAPTRSRTSRPRRLLVWLPPRARARGWVSCARQTLQQVREKRRREVRGHLLVVQRTREQDRTEDVSVTSTAATAYIVRPSEMPLYWKCPWSTRI